MRAGKMIPFALPNAAVPADFVGITAAAWPGADPEPPFARGLVRIHDTGCRWAEINTASGVYDWSKLDAQIAANAGRTIIYVLSSTPTWATSDATKSDPYGVVGGGAPPASMGSITAFISALLARYNGSTRKIHYIEFWNEPEFDGLSGRFWWASAAALVGQSVAVRSAALAADAGIKFMCPGVLVPSRGAAWLAAVDAGSGKTGAELIDAYSIHIYYMTPDAGDVVSRMNVFRAQLVAAGIAVVPIFVTELGVSATPGDAQHLAFLGLPAAQRMARLGRQLLLLASVGCAGVVLYSYKGNADGLCGNLFADSGGVVAAVQMAGLAAGKSISAVSQSPSGVVSFTAGGATYTL